MKFYRPFFLSLFMVVLASCYCLADDNDWTELRRVAKADPQEDFDKAIAQKDYRFVGVYGYALDVPGVPDYHEHYSKKYGVKAIPGTSDFIVNEEHKMLIEKAREYAKAYNKLLLEWIKKNEGK